MSDYTFDFHSCFRCGKLTAKENFICSKCYKEFSDLFNGGSGDENQQLINRGYVK